MAAMSAMGSASTGTTSPSIRPPSVLRRHEDHPSPTPSANAPAASTSASTSISTPSAWASPRLSSLSFLSSEPHARTSASTRASTWSTQSRSRSRGSLAHSSTSPAPMPGSSTFASSLTAPCPDSPTASTNVPTSMLSVNSKHRSHAEPLSGGGNLPRTASHKRSRSRSLDRGAGVGLLAPGKVSPRLSHIPFPWSGCTTAPSSPRLDTSTSLSVPASTLASTYVSALSSSSSSFSSPVPPVPPPTTSTSTYSTPAVEQLGKPLGLAPPVSGFSRSTSPNRAIARETSTRTARRDKRRSQSVSDLYHRSAEMGLGLSLEPSAPAPTNTHHDEGTDYFTLGMPFYDLIQVSADSLESALFKLTLAPKPVTHLLMPHVRNPELEQFLEERLPSLAPSLLVLKINDCQLTKLPPALKLCTHLEELDISRNPLGEKLPGVVSGLKSLRVLLVDQVGLASLPDWLAHFEQLKVLSASHNFLTYLPSSLYQLAHLERLTLNHNPWSPTWAPVLAAIVNGPASQSDLPLTSRSSVALDSAYGDDEAEDAPTPPPMSTKTPPRIFSALRTKRSTGDLKNGTKSPRSSLALYGLGATRKGGTKSSAPNTPARSSKSKGRQSNGSSDTERSDRSKWSFSLRRGKGLKLEPPPLPFTTPRRMSSTPSSSTLKPSRQPYSDTSTSASNSTTGLASASTTASALATGLSTPLTPLDVKRFSGLNFWEELSRPNETRTAVTSPLAFRSSLPDQGLAGPLSFLPVAHSTPPAPPTSSSASYRNSRHSRHSRASDEDVLWTHRQAVEHRVDIKHLLTYLRDMHDLQLAHIAYETAATAPTTQGGRGPAPVSGFPLSPYFNATPSAPSDLHRLSLPVYDLKRQDDPVYRRRVIEEIVASEETYVRGMQELSDVYVVQAQQPDPQTGSPVVPLAERQMAFGNLPALLDFHANAFLPALQAAARTLDTDPTALDAAEQVAEVFLAHASYFGMYADYVNNCDLAQSLVAYWDGLPVQPGVESRLSALLHSHGPHSPTLATTTSSEMAPSFSAPPGSLASTPTPSAQASTLTTSLTSASLKPANLPPLLVPSKPLAMLSPASRGSALSKSARKARQKYLRKCAADARRTHISIESYLLLPVQRVPRYCLLLEALAKVTPLPTSSSTTYSSTSRSASGSSATSAPTSRSASDHQLSSDDSGTALDAGPPKSSPHSSSISPSETPWIAAATALASAIDAVPDTIPALEHPAGSDMGTSNKLGDPLPTVAPSCSNGANASAGSALDRALVQMRELAQSINESKRHAEQNRRLVEWQAKIAGSFPSPLVQPHRRLVRDGVVMLRKIARLTTEPTSRSALGLQSGNEMHVPVLQQTVVEQPVVLLLCNDLAVFLQATSESLPMLRAAGQDAAAHAAITEAVASTCSLPGIAHDPEESPGPSNAGVSRPLPPDSAGRLLQAETQLVFELLAILRTGSWGSTAEEGLPPGPAVERLDKTTIKVMDHSKLFVLSAQSAGDADAWMTAFDHALD